MQVILIFAVLLFVGCAGLEPKVYSYPSLGGLKIIKASPHTIDSVCDSQQWDNGTYKKPGEHAPGCYDRETKEIWVRWDCIGAEAIVHEMAHHIGISDPENGGYGW